MNVTENSSDNSLHLLRFNPEGSGFNAALFKAENSLIDSYGLAESGFFGFNATSYPLVEDAIEIAKLVADCFALIPDPHFFRKLEDCSYTGIIADIHQALPSIKKFPIWFEDQSLNFAKIPTLADMGALLGVVYRGSKEMLITVANYGLMQRSESVWDSLQRVIETAVCSYHEERGIDGPKSIILINQYEARELFIKLYRQQHENDFPIEALDYTEAWIKPSGIAKIESQLKDACRYCKGAISKNCEKTKELCDHLYSLNVLIQSHKKQQRLLQAKSRTVQTFSLLASLNKSRNLLHVHEYAEYSMFNHAEVIQ